MNSESGTDQHLVSVEQAGVRFGKLQAVRDVSFSLKGGELLGLIGPNGAGKTTLLRAIAGLQPLSRGRVQLMGQPVQEGASDVLRHLGFTPDTPAFYDNLTVRQFLTFIGKGYELPSGEVRERIDFWLEKVWLEEKADQKIKMLSRGMRQRVGVARTLLPNPSLILLDEPAGGLDPAGRVQFRQLLCNLRDQGKTLIVSSHILADMSEYCTHIAIMSAGTMVQFGTVASFAAAHTSGSRCRYTLTLARPMTGLKQLLGTIDDVTDIQVNSDSEHLTLEYSSDREDAARLLADLIARRVPVASFAPRTPDLEEAYLRTGIQQVD